MNSIFFVSLRNVLYLGLNENYEDDSIDLSPYGMSSCFNGYGDAEKGFYSVYRLDIILREFLCRSLTVDIAAGEMRF